MASAAQFFSVFFPKDPRTIGIQEIYISPEGIKMKKNAELCLCMKPAQSIIEHRGVTTKRTKVKPDIKTLRGRI